MNERKMTTSRIPKLILNLFPGLLLCFFVMLIGIYLANLVGESIIILNLLPKGSTSPVSGIFVAILLGIIIRNTLGLHTIFLEGVGVSVKFALRAGIILLGLRLSLTEALKLGAWGIPLIVSCISCGLLVTLYLNRHFLTF